MTFQPIVPFSGLAGWSFLQRTIENQRVAHDNTATIQRDVEYFERHIGNVTSAEALVSDSRLLRVALGAFGLDEDIGNRYLIQKVLSDGTLDATALANRLSDKRYLALSEAFGFGDFETPRTLLSGFATEITDAFRERQFEIAVGEQDNDMRLALNLQRELEVLANRDSSEDTKWFTIMGSEPLRQVFETAFGLPDSFASIDIDQQLETFKSRAEATFGSSDLGRFADAEQMESLTRLFFARSQLSDFNASLSSANTALTLLQSAIR